MWALKNCVAEHRQYVAAHILPQDVAGEQSLSLVEKQSEKSNMAQRGGARPGAGRKKGAVSQAKLDIAAMAKEHAGAALKVLVAVANNAKAPSAARVSAATAILDRGFGKPRQSVELDGTMSGVMTVTYVSAAAGPSVAPSDEDYETPE